jgi:hypothetical protein
MAPLGFSDFYSERSEQADEAQFNEGQTGGAVNNAIQSYSFEDIDNLLLQQDGVENRYMAADLPKRYDDEEHDKDAAKQPLTLDGLHEKGTQYPESSPPIANCALMAAQ